MFFKIISIILRVAILVKISRLKRRRGNLIFYGSKFFLQGVDSDVNHIENQIADLLSLLDAKESHEKI